VPEPQRPPRPGAALVDHLNERNIREMTILVTGATDNVGSEVTCQLPARNPDVEIMTRRPDQIDTSTGIPGVHGHFEDPAELPVQSHRSNDLRQCNRRYSRDGS
jgi:hypothetical protein